MRLFGAEAADTLGSNHDSNLAAGDWNGDGISDLAIGAPQADFSANETRPNAGVVYLLLGSSTWSTLDPAQYQFGNPVPPDLRIIEIGGALSGDEIGTSLTFGDWDGDGFDDLAVGANKASPGIPPRPAAGVVTIIFGGDITTNSLNIIDLAAPPNDLRVKTIWGESSSGRMGWASTRGDMNADGLDDLAIGAVAASPSGSNRTQCGEVIIFSGGSLAFDPATTTPIDLALPAGTYGEIRIWGAASNDELGRSLASGDINADGITDLAIGSPKASPGAPPRNEAGTVYIIYGEQPSVSRGLTAPILDLSFASGTFGETRIYGGTAESELGTNIDIGYFNLDAAADLLIAAPLVDQAVGGDAGELVLIMGSTVKPGIEIGAGGSSVDLSEPRGTYGENYILGAAELDFLGISTAFADINSDGLADLFGGAPFADPEFPGRSTAGIVSAFFADNGIPGEVLPAPLGAPTTFIPGKLLDLSVEESDLLIYGERARDNLGTAMSEIGDFNDDGAPDFAVSAIDGRNLDNGLEAGYVAIIWGGDGASSPAITVRASPAGDQAPPLDFGVAIGAGLDYADELVSAQSATTATLIRSLNGVAGLGPRDLIANLLWKLETNREGWSEATIAFKPPPMSAVRGTSPTEITSIYQAPAPGGPWRRLPTEKNPLSGKLSAPSDQLGYFVIGSADLFIIDSFALRLD